MTGRNPNVFYEVGYAHALGKSCLLITSNAEDIPFDLKHHRHIIYGSSITKLKENLSRDLSFLKIELLNRKSPFRLEFEHIFGFVEKSDFEDWQDKAKRNYYCFGDVHFKLHIHNETAKSSPEIEDIYIYTGVNWKFRQNKADCISMKSDISRYSARHVIKRPHKRKVVG